MILCQPQCRLKVDINTKKSDGRKHEQMIRHEVNKPTNLGERVWFIFYRPKEKKKVPVHVMQSDRKLIDWTVFKLYAEVHAALSRF